MSFLAPYTSVMRLGQGFNSYTQEICIDDAVLIHPSAAASGNRQPGHPELATSRELGYRSDDFSNVATEPQNPSIFSQEQDSDIYIQSSHKGMNQTVKYSAHSVDNVADIVDTLNISSSATINYGSGTALGNTTFVKENNIGESDLNFIVSVKVTNELPTTPSHMEFNPIPGLSPSRFSSVYGDSFIAGFLEGGEFSAVVSITVHDKSKVSKIKTAAEIELSMASSKPVGGDISGAKDKEDIWENTEISVSVNWSGGGNIKKPKKSWDLTTVVRAASEFPSHVAKHSQRTSAILMNYNSLRSFQEYNMKAENPYLILDYRSCHLYTAELLSAFMYYRGLWRTISRMIKDNACYQTKECSEKVPNPIPSDPRSLNLARMECRKYMTLIIEETRRLAIEPELGRVRDDGTLRQPPYKFPAELAIRLPRYIGPSTDGSPSPSLWKSEIGRGRTDNQNALPALPSNLADQGSSAYRTCGPSCASGCRNNNHRARVDGLPSQTDIVRMSRSRKRRSCWSLSMLRWLSPTTWALALIRPQRLVSGNNQGLEGSTQARPRLTPPERNPQTQAGVITETSTRVGDAAVEAEAQES